MTVKLRLRICSVSYWASREICLRHWSTWRVPLRYDRTFLTRTTILALRCGTAVREPKAYPSCKRLFGLIPQQALAMPFSELLCAKRVN